MATDKLTLWFQSSPVHKKQARWLNKEIRSQINNAHRQNQHLLIGRSTAPQLFHSQYRKTHQMEVGWEGRQKFERKYSLFGLKFTQISSSVMLNMAPSLLFPDIQGHSKLCCRIHEPAAEPEQEEKHREQSSFLQREASYSLPHPDTFPERCEQPIVWIILKIVTIIHVFFLLTWSW